MTVQDDKAEQDRFKNKVKSAHQKRVAAEKKRTADEKATVKTEQAALRADYYRRQAERDLKNGC